MNEQKLTELANQLLVLKGHIQNAPVKTKENKIAFFYSFLKEPSKSQRMDNYVELYKANETKTYKQCRKIIQDYKDVCSASNPDHKKHQEFIQAIIQEKSEHHSSHHQALSTPLDHRPSQVRAEAQQTHQHARGAFHASFTTILNKKYQKQYADKAEETANWAQKIFSYNAKRLGQADFIEQLRKTLHDCCKQRNKEPGLEEAKLFYAALSALKQELQSEFRWTRWLNTKSRLENIIRQDMAVLENQFSHQLKDNQQNIKKSAGNIFKGKDAVCSIFLALINDSHRLSQAHDRKTDPVQTPTQQTRKPRR